MKRIEKSKRLSLKPEVIRALDNNHLERAAGACFGVSGRCGGGGSVEIICLSQAADLC